MSHATAAGPPLLWINLARATRRRARMEWAIHQGGWRAERFEAIDAADPQEQLWPLANPLQRGQSLPGLHRWQEAAPCRPTARSELACLASWQRLMLRAEAICNATGSPWILLMEDDLGSSLAVPQHWPLQWHQLTASAPPGTLAIQLAPISAHARQELHRHWQASGGRCLSRAKHQVRSHGNGAVLLHRQALARLIPGLARLAARWRPRWHPLVHPWAIRPVADKWLYGSLPPGSCQVLTYPLFCLEAAESSLHSDHVQAYHQPSRAATLELWQADGQQGLLGALARWDAIA